MVVNQYNNGCILRTDIPILGNDDGIFRRNIGRSSCLFCIRAHIGDIAGCQDRYHACTIQNSQAGVSGLFCQEDVAIGTVLALGHGIQTLGSCQVIETGPVVAKVNIHDPDGCFVSSRIDNGLSVHTVIAGQGYGHAGFFLHLLHIHGAVLSADILGCTQVDIFAGDIGTGACGEDAAVLHVNAYVSALGLDVLCGEIAVTGNGEVDIAVIVNRGVAGADADFHIESSGVGVAGRNDVCFCGDSVLADGLLVKCLTLFVSKQIIDQLIQINEGASLNLATQLRIQQQCKELLLTIYVSSHHRTVDRIRIFAVLQDRGNDRFCLSGSQQVLLLLIRKAFQHSQAVQQLFPLLIADDFCQYLAGEFVTQHTHDHGLIQSAVQGIGSINEPICQSFRLRDFKLGLDLLIRDVVQLVALQVLLAGGRIPGQELVDLRVIHGGDEVAGQQVVLAAEPGLVVLTGFGIEGSGIRQDQLQSIDVGIAHIGHLHRQCCRDVYNQSVVRFAHIASGNAEQCVGIGVTRCVLDEGSVSIALFVVFKARAAVLTHTEGAAHSYGIIALFRHPVVKAHIRTCGEAGSGIHGANLRERDVAGYRSRAQCAAGDHRVAGDRQVLVGRQPGGAVCQGGISGNRDVTVGAGFG